jgi:hypothetical protein
VGTHSPQPGCAAVGKLWSYITGKKGTSRVRVYERYDDSPLHVEWYLDGQRYQRSLKTETGQTIRDKRDAKRIADEMADALERSHRSAARRRLWGVAPGKTVGQLLNAMHEARAHKWSDTYTRDQDRFRRFWTEKLGADTPIVEVSEPLVERALWDELDERRPATRNRYRRYIVDAFGYAQRKLKWIEERHNLSAVDFEDPKSRKLDYSQDEVTRLLEGLAGVGMVPEWIGHVLWQTGRRLSAVRTLPKKAVTLEEDRAVVDWPEETDKARKRGVSILVGRAHELSRELMAGSGKYVAGRSPPSLDTCEKVWLPEAEKRAAIEHVEGRAWHGIKRRFSTATKGLKGRDKQAGTLESTLRSHYEVDDDLEAKAEVAALLARRVEGP